MSLPIQRYVSSELAHFVGRGLEAEKQYSLLLKILNECLITHPPHNPNISGNLTVNTSIPFSSNKMFAPEIVCFCDIPTADLRIHVGKYSSFGLSFSKDFIVRQGGCPVFYIPREATVKNPKNVPPHELMRLIRESGPNALFEDISKCEHLDRMIGEYFALVGMFRNLVIRKSNTPGVPDEHSRLMKLEQFFNFHIFSYIKFFDHTYPDDHEDNYYMEREWRVVGNVEFKLEDIETIFMPKTFSSRFRTDFPSYISQLVFV